MPNLSNLRKSIFYLQQALRNDYNDDKELLQALAILADFNMKPTVLSKLETIAGNYHERVVCAQTSALFSNKKLFCPTCYKEVITLTSIESDDRDYSKDLSICIDCYIKIVDIWKINTPGKICPV